MLLDSGDVKRAKYHDDSKKVSKVSVSLIAGFPEYGHVVNFQVGWFSNGLPGSDRSMSSGSSTGRLSSGNCTNVPSSRYIMGIGHPQYLCLETPQSLNLNFTVFLPILSSISFSIILSLASFTFKPFKKSELTRYPSSTKASFNSSLMLSIFSETTCLISREYFFAKSKSL